VIYWYYAAAFREAGDQLFRLAQLRLPGDYAEMRGWVLKLGLRVVVRPRSEQERGPRWRFGWR
jgi:hypothetical protein